MIAAIAWRVALVLGCALVLSGCATPSAAPALPSEWQAVLLPGKRATEYRSERKDGRLAVAAIAGASASMWRRPAMRAPEAIGEVEFSWWVQAIPGEGDVSRADRDDAAARLIFSFDGELARLSARNQMLFDLARALTGEAPPSPP